MPKEQCMLVKTASEIALKSDYVRRFFTKKLVRNLRFALKRNKVEVKEVLRGGGRLYLFSSSPKKAQKILSLVPGIHAIAIAERHMQSGYPDIEAPVLAFAKNTLKKGNSFALRARVVNNKGLSRRDLEVRLGAAIQKKIPGLKVNLDKPGKQIFIEARKKDFFLYTQQKPGLGGLPIGVEGSIALLASGKKDELLAAFLMLRRGCNVFPVVKKAGAKMENFLAKLVPLNNFRKFALTEEKELQNLIKERNIQAIVTADSAVDARSLASYKKFDAKQPLLVLRPLLLFPREMKREAEKLFH